FFFSSRRRHTRSTRDWSSDVCSSDLFGLPIDSTISLRQFNTTTDPNGNPYLGLAYVITVALMTVVIGTLFLREPRGAKIWSEVGGEEPGMLSEASPAE